MTNPNAPRVLVPKQARGRPIPARNLTALAEAANIDARVLRGPRQTPVSAADQPQVQRFRIVTVAKDWLVCRTWDGTALGETDVYVAKDPMLRGSVTAFDTATYSGYNSTYTERTSSISGQDDETQVVVPKYLTTADTGDDNVRDIYAARNPGGGTGVYRDEAQTVELEWLEIRPARMWAKKNT